MQHGILRVVEWLRREWGLVAICAVNGYNGLRASRSARRRLREPAALGWPAIEGIARCRMLPGSAVHLRAEPVDGRVSAEWGRGFASPAEARHYRIALNGLGVPVHVNPEKPEERIVCWQELRTLVPEFAWPDGGRLDVKGFRWVRVLEAFVVGLAMLAVTDVGLFSTPWGRNIEWHGMCLCELSIGLLVASSILLLPAFSLRRRMNAAGLDPSPDWVRRTTRTLGVSALGAWLGLLLFGLMFGRDAGPCALWADHAAGISVRLVFCGGRAPCRANPVSV